MDVQDRANVIDERLADGRLPRIKPVTVWAELAETGGPCEGCGDLILPREVRREAELPTGTSLKLHSVCATLWQRMVQWGEPL